MKNEIIPAILVDDLDEFVEKINICEDFAETVQWDIMDGQFVESVTFSDLDVFKTVDTVLNIEADLMVEAPEELFEKLALAGVDRVVIHVEVIDDLKAVILKMKDYQFEVGVSLNPETGIEEIEDVVDLVDEVLIMTVVPGAGGREFIPEMLEKIRTLRKTHPKLNIAVDGGINMETIIKAKEAGANRFIVGTSIFSSPDPANAFDVLKKMINE